MIHLRDYLHDIPLRFLKRIAEHLGVTAEYGARIKLLNAIDRALWDDAFVARVIGALTEEKRQVLSLVAFSFDSGITESAISNKTGLAESRVREILDELLLSALVGGVRPRDPVFFTPHGVGEKIRRVLMGKMVILPVRPDCVPPSPFPALLEDVCSLAAEAHREPLPVTLKGTIRKNILERAFAGSPPGDEPCGKYFLPHRDDFVVEYLRERGLLGFSARKAELTPAFGGWIGMSAGARFRDITAFVLRHYLPSEIVQVAGVLGELPAGAAMNPADFARFLHERTPVAGALSSIRSRMQKTFCALNHLGALRYTNGIAAVTPAGADAFRGETPPGDRPPPRNFTVQPSFEVILGPEFDLRVRFILELMSVRKSRDIIITNIIEKAGITRARERGMSVAEILSFFEEHSRTPLPQNVRFSIRSWAESYGSVTFETAALMRFRDAAACEGAMHIPEIAPYVRERLSGTVLVVSEERVPVIARILREAGWFPEMPGETVGNPLGNVEPYHPETIQDVAAEHLAPLSVKGFITPADRMEEGKEWP